MFSVEGAEAARTILRIEPCTHELRYEFAECLSLASDTHAAVLVPDDSTIQFWPTQQVERTEFYSVPEAKAHYLTLPTSIWSNLHVLHPEAVDLITTWLALP